MKCSLFLLCVLGVSLFTPATATVLSVSVGADAPLPNVASTPVASITCAIASRTVIAFTYHGTARTVQPHRLGRSKASAHKTLLRAYELTKNGSPSNTWKLYDLQKISNLTLTPTTFPQNAPGYTPSDKALSSPLAEVPYVETKKETK
jgi:predicted DNA-binding transcriptional regulator YafY